MAEQVGDFGAPALSDILVHRGVIRRSGLDHPLHLGMQVQRRGGLATGSQQLSELGAERGDLFRMVAQAAVAAIVEHAQRIDRAVQRQLAP
ncbi:hypothetical protein D9M68_944230 [compost metagenome]